MKAAGPTGGARARAEVFGEWARIAAGLFVFAFGTHLTIYANIGLAPWDCLGVGISLHTPLNYGLAMTAVCVLAIFVDILMKEPVGYGTIIDALLTGNFVQIFNDIDPLPENRSLLIGAAVMLAGFVFMSIGMCIYMKAGQCCGPRDALLVAIGRRAPRVSIGAVEIALWAGVLLVGWLLGGPVGPGTLLGTFGFGAVMQLVFGRIGFEPRAVRHRSAAEINRVLRGGG